MPRISVRIREVSAEDTLLSDRCIVWDRLREITAGLLGKPHSASIELRENIGSRADRNVESLVIELEMGAKYAALHSLLVTDLAAAATERLDKLKMPENAIIQVAVHFRGIGTHGTIWQEGSMIDSWIDSLLKDLDFGIDRRVMYGRRA